MVVQAGLAVVKRQKEKVSVNVYSRLYNNPFKKKNDMGKSITWQSDAPDAKGKFKNLSPSGLASWLIKTRKGKLNRIISSLNQQVCF